MSSAATARTGPAARLMAATRSGPLGVRDFRLFTIGQLTSTIGDFCYAVALPWLVLSTNGGTVLLGTVLACYGIPRTVLIPLGGALSDRLSARSVMLVADSVRCVLVAVLAVLAARGLASIGYLGPVAALIGAGEGLFLPASAAIMPSLLPADDLQAGNGLSAAAIQFGSLAGPVLGGILVGLAGGSATAFAVDAATFAVSAGALALMRGRRQPATAAAGSPAAAARPEGTAAGHGSAAAAPESPGTADSAPAGTGQTAPEPTGVWQLLRQAREFQMILVVAVLANFVIAAAFEVALPTLAHSRFGAAYSYGALVASFGLGSLTGTLIAARLKSLRRPSMSACAGIIISAVAVALVPYLGGLPGAAAGAAVFGGAAYFGNVVYITVVQRWAPAHLMGRVMSLIMLAAIGTYPISVALSGVIIRSTGPAPFFPIAGAVLLVAILAAMSQRRFRDFGARDDAEPDDSGPDQAAVVAAR